MKRIMEIDYILDCGLDVAREIYVYCINNSLLVEKVICEYFDDNKK